MEFTGIHGNLRGSSSKSSLTFQYSLVAWSAANDCKHFSFSSKRRTKWIKWSPYWSPNESPNWSKVISKDQMFGSLKKFWANFLPNSEVKRECSKNKLKINFIKNTKIQNLYQVLWLVRWACSSLHSVCICSTDSYELQWSYCLYESHDRFGKLS